MAVDRPRWIWPERRYFQFCLAASAFLFLVAAVFSTGSHNPDEYLQTVEFASTKLSMTDPAELPWEYGERMRSWLQPAIYVGVARAAEHFGIQRPLTLLFLFRLLTAVIAWSSLWTLVVAGRRWVDGEAERRRLYSIAAFLWLLPFLGVRTSGETISTCALCFGIALLEWRTNLRNRGSGFAIAVLAGMAFGLCFDFRYATGVMAAGAGLWYLHLAQRRLSLFAGLTLGALSALALAALADWWGYGSLTFPAYAYVYQNFVMGRANFFGTDPFYAYLYLPLQEAGAMAPLVLALMVATLIAWVVRARSVLTWASAPYVALLCIAAHKEPRFLFPLAPFLPFFAVFALAWQPAVGARLTSLLQWLTTGYRLKFAYLLNAGGLVGVILLPQGANFPLYELIEDQSFAAHGPLEAVAIYTPPNNKPYWYVGKHMAFLEPKNLRWTLNPSAADLEAKHSRGETFLALVDIPVPLAEPAAWIRSQCTFVWSTFPRWLEPYNFNHWQERSHWWEFYRCAGASS